MLGKGSEHIELDCGRPYEHLRAWLDDELALARSGETWTFLAEGARCTVAIEALESRPVGGLRIQRTKLVVEGEDRALAAFMRAFTLRFVSAGG